MEKIKLRKDEVAEVTWRGTRKGLERDVKIMKAKDIKRKVGKILVSLGILIILISTINAATEEINITSGECNQIEFPNEYPVNWKVEGNSSNMEGFSFNKSGLIITYCFDKFFKADSFTLTFYNSGDEITVSGSESVSSSSSGRNSYNYKIIPIPHNYTNCDEGTKICKANELWICENGKWKMDTLCYKCEDGKCFEAESESEEVEEKNGFGKAIIFIIGAFFIAIGIGFVISFIIGRIGKEKGKKIKEKKE